MSAVNPIPQPAEQPRFIPTESGGFIDTGAIYAGADGAVEVLEWSKDLGRATFSNAQKICAELGDGFRAPSPHELVGIVNYDKYSPATDAPGIDSDWYWTNQVDASSPHHAFCVGLRSGCVYWSYQDYGGRVRAVRRVRASQHLTLGL